MRTGDGDTNVTPVQKSIGSNRLRCRCVSPGSGVFVVEEVDGSSVVDPRGFEHRRSPQHVDKCSTGQHAGEHASLRSGIEPGCSRVERRS
jgi:hypothetical protein